MSRRRSAHARLRVLWGLWFLAASSSRAWAEPPAASAESAESQEYQRAVAQAVAEFDAQHYLEARALFREAHRISPSARSLRALGTVEFELGNYPECVELLEQALHSRVRALEGPALDKTEELLARARRFVGKVRLELLPKGLVGSTLQVDGEPVTAAAGGLLVLRIGEHTLAVSAPGYRALSQRVHVEGADVQDVTLTLQPNVPDV
ncbi:MAG TPA: PEGA domain-containing protein, partial [Polyangiales bacterium]